MRTNFFCKNFLNTARGPGHPGQNPGTSQIPPFETQGRKTFEGGHEVFGHHPFPWKTPTPPDGLRTQKINLFGSFFWPELNLGASGLFPIFSEGPTKARVGGSQKGGFQKGGFGGCPPGTKTGTRYVCQNHPFTKPPFYLPVSLFGVDKRVVSKRVVSADVPQERKPERGHVRQNHPFKKPPFY